MDPTQQQQPPLQQQQQQQQQLQPQAYGPVYAPQPPLPVYQASKSWRIAKIVFLSLSIIFSIIVIGISAAAVVSSLSYVIIWTAPQAVVAICWAIADLITFCVRKGKSSIHPGAHVALHLLLWLGWLIAVGLNSYSLAYTVGYYGYDYDYGYDSYSGYGYDRYGIGRDTYAGLLQALVAFSALLVVVHFFLFVRACIETAERNRMPRTQFVMAAPPPQMYQQQQPQQQYAAGYPQYAGYYPQQQQQPQQPQQQWNAQGGADAVSNPTGVESHVTGSSGGGQQQQQQHMSYPSSAPSPPPQQPVGHELPPQQQH